MIERSLVCWSWEVAFARQRSCFSSAKETLFQSTRPSCKPFCILAWWLRVGLFLWNKGATKSNAGVLAAFNNAVVPLPYFVPFSFLGNRRNSAKSNDSTPFGGIDDRILRLAHFLQESISEVSKQKGSEHKAPSP